MALFSFNIGLSVGGSVTRQPSAHEPAPAISASRRVAAAPTTVPLKRQARLVTATQTLPQANVVAGDQMEPRGQTP